MVTRVVPCSPEKVYAVLADLSKYPEFLPNCSVVETRGESPMDVTIGFNHANSFHGGLSAVESTVALAGWGATPGERVHYEISSQYGRHWSMVAEDTLSCERVSYDWRLYPTAVPPGTEEAAEACEVRLSFSIQFNSILLLPGWDLQRMAVIEERSIPHT